MRSVALSIREKEFVEAARMVEASNWRIVRSHVFPHLVGPLIVLATLNVAAFILAEAGLSFLGLGIQLPTASWGLLADAPQYYTSRPPDGLARRRAAPDHARLQPPRRRPARRLRPEGLPDAQQRQRTERSGNVRKATLALVLAVASLALIVVAAASAAPAAKRGGTIVLDISTDVDYIDPQLSYYGETWKLEAATACKLMNWQDKEGAAGAVATPEVSAGLPVVSKTARPTRSRSSRASSSRTARA